MYAQNPQPPMGYAPAPPNQATSYLAHQPTGFAPAFAPSYSQYGTYPAPGAGCGQPPPSHYASSTYTGHPAPSQHYVHYAPQHYASPPQPQPQPPQPQQHPQTHAHPFANLQQQYGVPARSPAPTQPVANGIAIPAPTQRVEYQAPVFKTFQERKREREAALRAASAPIAPPTPPPQHQQHQGYGQGPSPMRNASPAPIPSPRNVSPAPLHQQIPPSPSYDSPSIHQHTQPPSPMRNPSSSSHMRSASPAPPSPAPRSPSGQSLPPAALAMMAARGGSRPVPPPRQSSTPQQVLQPLPRSPTPCVPLPVPSTASPAPPVALHAVRRAASPAPPAAFTAPSRAATPAPPEIALPKVVPARDASPSPSVPPAIVAPQVATAPAPRVVTPTSTSTASPAPSSPAPSTRALPRPAGPLPKPSYSYPTPPTTAKGSPATARQPALEAMIERSDTVSSVKSLDRAVMGAKRMLPRPPVGVSPSRSLDRGPAPAGGASRSPRRASPITEESPEQLAARMAGVSIGGVVPKQKAREKMSSVSPSPALPSLVGPPPVLAITGISGKPASPPLPTISIGDKPPVPSINVGPAVPSISVGDAKPPVPSISVGSVPAINVPTIAVGVPAISVSPSPPGAPCTPSINITEAPLSPPAFAFSGLPTIEVESGDTRDPRSIPPPTRHSHQRRSSGNTVAPSRIEPTAAILCAGCTNPIIGRIVSAMKQRWHPQCFQCGVCGELLEHVSAYEHEGRPYCHLDYHDRFAHRCHHCRTPIVDPRFITLDDELLGQRFYHELHFFCSECGDPFLDPSKSSAAGAELHCSEGDEGEEGETNDFVIHKGHPYCERCHLRLHKPKCAACKDPIPDVAVSAMGAKWHTKCFVCDNCSQPFANNLFFPRDGKAFCTECFENMA